MTANAPGSRSLAKDTPLDRYLESLRHLPPTPMVMIKLMELFRQPDHDLSEIVLVMSKDPAMTAELLRRCNCLVAKGEASVADVYEAAFRLGFNELYRISMVVFGRHTMSSSAAAKGIRLGDVWRHSAVTAFVADCLARKLKLEEAEVSALTAGLLHDVGKVVLAMQEGVKYARLQAMYGEWGPALCDAEKATFGFNHAEIGGRLLSRWGVPAQVVVPVLCHHQPTWSGPFAELSAVVCLANVMAHFFDNPAPSAYNPDIAEAVNAMSQLGLTHQDVSELEPIVRTEIERLGQLFQA